MFEASFYVIFAAKFLNGMVLTCNVKIFWIIEGTIPDDLFHKQSLRYLTLFNNYLSGLLPSINHEFEYIFAHSNRLSCSVNRDESFTSQTIPKTTRNTLIITGNSFLYPELNTSYISAAERSHNLTVPSDLESDMFFWFIIISILFTIPLICFLCLNKTFLCVQQSIY